MLEDKSGDRVTLVATVLFLLILAKRQHNNPSFFHEGEMALFVPLFSGLNILHVYLQHISTIPRVKLTKVPLGLRPYLALCSILPQLQSVQAHSPLLVCWFSY